MVDYIDFPNIEQAFGLWNHPIWSWYAYFYLSLISTC